jgi:hypothetical protein
MGYRTDLDHQTEMSTLIDLRARWEEGMSVIPCKVIAKGY